MSRPPYKQAVSAAFTTRQVWPFFSTSFKTFAGVMVPIAGMMLLPAVLPRVPLGLRLTAGLVAAVSVYAGYRGYGHRVEVTPEGVAYRRFGRCFRLKWAEIRHIGRYIPLDRNRASQYVYITRLDIPPVDWREIDDHTIQLQDRPGLLERLQEQWQTFMYAEITHATECLPGRQLPPEEPPAVESPSRRTGHTPLADSADGQ